MQKGAVVIFGVISLFGVIAGSLLLLAAIENGFYFREIHTKMIDCAGFVRNHIAENPRYPTDDMIKNWSRENDVSPPFILGGRGSGNSIPVFDGTPHNSESGSFRIAYSGGDRMEFFNSWDESFTTSVRQNSGERALYGLALLAIGFVSFRMRGCLENTKSEQDEDGKAPPAIS